MLTKLFSGSESDPHSPSCWPTQRTLPYGTVEEVREETRRLLNLGKKDGYILSPAHAVEGDVPLDNMLAFVDEALSQPGLER